MGCPDPEELNGPGDLTGDGDGNHSETDGDGDPNGGDGDSIEELSFVFAEPEFRVVLNGTRRPEVEVVNSAGETLARTPFFESADPEILEISSAGIAIGRALGSTTLTVRLDELEEEWPARVVAAQAAQVSVVPANFTLLVGAQVQYLASARDAGNREIEEGLVVGWSTTDSSVASISAQGIAQAIAPGIVEVIATVDGVEGRANLEVVEAEVESIAISPVNLPELSPGESYLLEARAFDLEGTEITGLTFVWESSDTAVATVDDGQITAHRPGMATITATLGTLSAQVNVEVIFTLQEVLTGNGFGCAIAMESLFCWGANDLGQLGLGDTTPRQEATALGAGPGLLDVALGRDHGCYITGENDLYCWGRNDFGQAGQPAGAPLLTPTQVTTSQNFVALHAGADHSCALTNSGQAYCWGRNHRLQGGHNGEDTHTPTAIQSSLSFESLALGHRHSCGVTTANTAYCWGADDYGQLGKGSTGGPDSSTPSAVIGGYSAARLSAGEDFTCGVSNSGLPYCWGRNNRGQIGNNSTTDTGTPRVLALQQGVSLFGLSTGRNHSCALSSGGAVLCWGAFEDGRLGLTTSADQLSPLPAGFTQTFSQLASGDGLACGRTATLDIYCWGRAPGSGPTPVLIDLDFP